MDHDGVLQRLPMTPPRPTLRSPGPVASHPFAWQPSSAEELFGASIMSGLARAAINPNATCPRLIGAPGPPGMASSNLWQPLLSELRRRGRDGTVAAVVSSDFQVLRVGCCDRSCLLAPGGMSKPESNGGSHCRLPEVIVCSIARKVESPRGGAPSLPFVLKWPGLEVGGRLAKNHCARACFSASARRKNTKDPTRRCHDA